MRRLEVEIDCSRPCFSRFLSPSLAMRSRKGFLQDVVTLGICLPHHVIRNKKHGAQMDPFAAWIWGFVLLPGYVNKGSSHRKFDLMISVMRFGLCEAVGFVIRSCRKLEGGLGISFCFCFALFEHERG